MSRENIEIVARDSAALNRGDVDEAMQFFAPDAELRDLAGAPDQPGVVKGADAIREAWLLWTAEFDELSDEPEEWIDAGDVVIRRTHWQGRGKAAASRSTGTSSTSVSCETEWSCERSSASTRSRRRSRPREGFPSDSWMSSNTRYRAGSITRTRGIGADTCVALESDRWPDLSLGTTHG